MISIVKKWKSTEPWQGYKKAKEYDEAAFRQTERQKVVKNIVEPNLIRKYLKEGDKVLDLGCGTGRISMPIYHHGCKLSVMDNSEGMLEVFKEKNPKEARHIEFKIGDVCNIPWPDNTFDAITAITVVRHFPEYIDVIKEMRRVVKPGGLIIFEVGSGECLRAGNEKEIYSDAQKDPNNPCTYDTFLCEPEIRAVLGGLKFKIIDLLSYDMLNSNFFLKGLLQGEEGTDDCYDYWWGNLMKKFDEPGIIEFFTWLSQTLFIHLPKEWGYNTLIIAKKME